jgi:hypothetical protein
MSVRFWGSIHLVCKLPHRMNYLVIKAVIPGCSEIYALNVCHFDAY